MLFQPLFSTKFAGITFYMAKHVLSIRSVQKLFKFDFFVLAKLIGQKYLKFEHFFICALNRNGKWQ